MGSSQKKSTKKNENLTKTLVRKVLLVKKLLKETFLI